MLADSRRVCSIRFALIAGKVSRTLGFSRRSASTKTFRQQSCCFLRRTGSLTEIVQANKIDSSAVKDTATIASQRRKSPSWNRGGGSTTATEDGTWRPSQIVRLAINSGLLLLREVSVANAEPTGLQETWFPHQHIVPTTSPSPQTGDAGNCPPRRLLSYRAKRYFTALVHPGCV
jgi:hypothetical protein